jgi:pSer/pThr/pTyr-binding forkhead associated (FHA) protein
MSDDSTRVMPPGTPATGQTGTFDRTMVAGTGQTMPPTGMGATMQMPATGLNDPYRTQMGGTTVCPVCKSTTPLMETFCGECGYLLSSAPAESLDVPQEEAPAAELIAEADGQRHKLRQGVNTLGRQGTDILVNEGTISRVHARITIEGNAITVEDMGSTNGTKVGDRRIGPNQPTPATPGTTLRFGNWRALLQLGGLPSSPQATGANAPATLMGGNQTVIMPVDDRTLAGLPESTTGINATQIYQPGDLNVADAPADVVKTATVLEPAVADGNIVARLTPTSGPGVEIVVTEGTISIGRRPGNTIVISNDAYISGRHAQIETDTTGTYLTDVGSTNGSSVNGQKMTPGERQLLLEGDEVQLGQTKYVYALELGTDVAPPFVPITPPSLLMESIGSVPSNTDGSPPGQEFGAINDPIYPPQANIKEMYHAVDNEVPE